MMFVASIRRLVKNGHQDIHDELHGRIVIIVKQDLIHFRFCHLTSMMTSGWPPGAA